jgi:cyanophycinase
LTGRTFALLGSGEFDPWAAEVDRWAISRNGSAQPRVLVLPTASAMEGEGVFEMWGSKGMAHYEGLSIQAEVVPLRSREDAFRQDLVDKLGEATMVFFSGGNPAYLASVLRDTPFWTGILESMDRGLVYGGCSAGVACLADMAPDSDADPSEAGRDIWQPGLGLFHGVRFMPHWDALDSFQPGLQQLIVGFTPAGQVLVGIDEDTAIVGDGSAWSVIGASKARVYLDGDWQLHGTGDSFSLPGSPLGVQ